MPPHKAAAKKTAAKFATKHDEKKDLRRAYEHLGRVQVLHASLGKDTGQVATLTRLAEQQLAAKHAKEAADLLRAAEHFSFGVLASAKAEADLDGSLQEAIEEEFDHKLQKANEHWEKDRAPDVLVSLYEGACTQAHTAYAAGAYRKALEFVRGAEALAHVHLAPAKHLQAGVTPKGQLSS